MTQKTLECGGMTRKTLECGGMTPPWVGATCRPLQESGDMSPHSKSSAWHHAPVHWLEEQGIYMVTAGTLQKKPFFRTPNRLDLLQERLFTYAQEFGWQLQAWAVFSNHYHFVAASPENREISGNSSASCT